MSKACERSYVETEADLLCFDDNYIGGKIVCLLRSRLKDRVTVKLTQTQCSQAGHGANLNDNGALKF